MKKQTLSSDMVSKVADWHDRWIEEVECEFLLRDKMFNEAQSGITSTFCLSGRFGSGQYCAELFKALDTEIGERANLVVKIIKAHLNSVTNLTDLQVTDAQPRAQFAMSNTYNHILHQTEISPGMCQADFVRLKQDSKLNFETCCTKMKIQIATAGGTAMSTHAQKVSNVTNVTVIGDGNATQAGIYNSKVTLDLVSNNSSKLSDELEKLIVSIQNSDASEPHKAELIEVIDDARVEITKPSPNQTKIAGLLQGLATSIQTIASISGAWDVFKNAVSTLGIDIS
jgi:hypothetical protein